MADQPSGASRIAGALLAARRGGPKLAPAEARELDTAGAYAVQREVAARSGGIGGFKVARRPGQATLMAPILRADVHASPARFGPDAFTSLGIELEVGFRILAPLPPAVAPGFRAAARDALAVVPVIEVVDSRLADADAATPELKLADNQLNGAVIVGGEVRDWQGLDLAAVEAKLTVGSERVLDGRAEVPGGDAFDTFCELASIIGDHCGGLAPGQVVITGSLNPIFWCERGVRVAGRIAGIGEVAAEFAR